MAAHTQEDLAKLVECHKERLRVETSELARDVRAEDDELLVVLESLQIQLSQIHSLELQVKHFVDKLQPVFIEVCQKMSARWEERQVTKKQLDELEEDDEKEILMSIAKILDTLIA